MLTAQLEPQQNPPCPKTLTLRVAIAKLSKEALKYRQLAWRFWLCCVTSFLFFVKTLFRLLDNQLVKNEASPQKIVLLLLAILLACAILVLGVYQFRLKDPYIRDVLALTGDSVKGHAIFQMNCSGCHGIEAAGHVGPSLKGVSDRKSKVGLIRQVTSGQTPPMPQFQPTTQEMADLLEYLESL